VREVFARSFRDRKALAGFAGLTGTPFNSGGREREQGISKRGNPRIRRLPIQLAWRWLRHQPERALSLWFVERVGDIKGRVRKIAVVALARKLLVALARKLLVALARKLLVALWRYLETGEVPAGVRFAAA